MQNGIKSEREIIEDLLAFQKSRILLTAIELEVFTILSGKLLTAEEVARELETETNVVERLLNALFALGYLRKAKGKFYNSKVAEEYLVEGKENFIGIAPHYSFLWDSWSKLTYKLKPNFKKKNATESFIKGMHYRGKKDARLIPFLLSLNNVKKMLDVGCGSGVFSYGIIDAKPDVHADLLDLPDVINMARKYAEKEGKTKNVNFIPADYKTVELKQKYDLILLSSVIHSNSFEENEKLIRKCSNALNPKGQLVIRDYVMNADRTEPAKGTLFSINMLVNTSAGDVFTKDEIISLLETAGLKNIEFKEAGKSSTIVIAQKGS